MEAGLIPAEFQKHAHGVDNRVSVLLIGLPGIHQLLKGIGFPHRQFSAVPVAENTASDPPSDQFGDERTDQDVVGAQFQRAGKKCFLMGAHHHKNRHRIDVQFADHARQTKPERFF